MTTTKPIAVFASDEDLLRAVRRVQGTLALSGLKMTPHEEAVLIEALREGVSHEQYLRWVEEEVLFGRRCTRSVVGGARVAVDGDMNTSKPIAAFASEQDLLDAVATAKASLATSGVEMSADAETMLIRALREGISEDEYTRWVEDAVFWGKQR
jgi:hypothetical protein